MKAIERLYQYFDFKGIKPTHQERDMGIGNGYFSGQLKRNADIGSSILEKIIEYNQDLNLYWLISGTGKMIIIDNVIPKTLQNPEYFQSGYTGPPECEKCKMKDQIITSLHQQVEVQNKLIELMEEKNSPSEYGQKRKAAS